MLRTLTSVLEKWKKAGRKQEDYQALEGSAHLPRTNCLALLHGTSLILLTCPRPAFSPYFMPIGSGGCARQNLVLCSAKDSTPFMHHSVLNQDEEAKRLSPVCKC